MNEPVAERVKHALLIGIDAYPRIRPLHGCVNDVTLMREVLQQTFGFAAERITMLTNGEATRDAILAALDQLVERTGRNDIVVIHYAGHGSQMTDREGDEPSGLDSTIMPFDSEGWQGDNRDITDDEILLRLLQLERKTPYTTLIFDCCHSGTISRDAFGEDARSQPPDTRPAEQLPPSPVPESMRSGARDSGNSGWLPSSDSYVLLAGCRDEEQSYEYRPQEGEGNVQHGALTFFLARELRQLAPNTTWRDVFERVAARVTAARPVQHPQLEGSIDRVVFDVAEIEPMQYARITARSGDTVTLAWGAAMGATRGSRYDVFAQSAKDAGQNSPLGSIEISDVQATSSTARIIAESSADAITADTRAVLTQRAYGDLRAGVQLVAADESAAAALRQRLHASPLLQLTDADTALARVYLLEPRAQSTAADAVPQIQHVPARSWAVVRKDGLLLLPLAPLEDVDRIVRALENAARYAQALALENPDADSKLRGHFDVELMRREAEQWMRAEPEPGSGVIAFQENDVIDIRIVSRHDAPVFVTVLDFGLKTSVQPLYPQRGASEQLRPGGWFSVSRERGMRLAFPDLPDTGAGAPREGLEVIKLIVTSQPADFSWLRQEDVRSASTPSNESPLQALWRAAASGGGTRELVMEPDTNEDWTTVSRPFLLRRKPA